MNRIPGRILLLTAAFALLLVPIAALGANGDRFQDVGDGNVFRADIEWLAATGVTKGCNPPANTEFCPDDAVTRGQMAAFIHRLAKNPIVYALDSTHAGLADSATHAEFANRSGRAETAAFADNADKLHGLLPGNLTSDAFSTYHDAAMNIPSVMGTILELQDLFEGGYVVIAKTHLFNNGNSKHTIACELIAWPERDRTEATVDAYESVPLTLTVVGSFASSGGKAVMTCEDNGSPVTVNGTKITAIGVDEVFNTAG